MGGELSVSCRVPEDGCVARDFFYFKMRDVPCGTARGAVNPWTKDGQHGEHV